MINSDKYGKVRIVCNAAAKAGKVSLNDNLLKGPDWVVSFFGIILKFPQHKIAFTAGIREMFHCVQIGQEDTYAQFFIWRNLNTHKTPKTYRMKARLFGTASCKFSVQLVKNYNARNMEISFRKQRKLLYLTTMWIIISIGLKLKKKL